jgi:hypothetical protein
MKITNKYNLPDAIVKAVSGERQLVDNRISATTLIGSPLRRKLMIQYGDQLEDDASNRLWSLLGSAMHSVLEQNLPDGALSELKLNALIGDITVSGIMDLYDNGTISDYKVTSVWAFILGDKPEWERQLNVYAYLCERCGYPVNGLEIVAILRDWNKYGKGTDYPSIPFQRITCRLWSPEEREAYVKERIRLHFHAEPTECTPEEKWERPTTYRVMKKGRKTAVRVFENQVDADNLIAMNVEYYLEVRKGVCVRCKDYCAVNVFCPYYKEEAESTDH